MTAFYEGSLFKIKELPLQNLMISGFSDEIGPAFDLQLSEFNKLGIKFIEVRGVDGKNISTLTMDEVDEMKQKLSAADIAISCIGSPAGKIDITESFEQHFELFKHIVAIAERLDVKYIRIFSFFIPEGDKPGQYSEEVIRRLKMMVAYIEDKDVILLHENEKDIYGDTTDRCLEIYQAINHPKLKLIFDFANFVQVGENTLEAYSELKEHIEYFHIKDALHKDGTVVVPGDGDGHLSTILKEAVLKNGYSGFLSLEPHLVTFDGLQDLENDPVKQAEIERAPVEAFGAAHEALTHIIEEIKAA